eukprot:2130239-Amphidinium_carterae.1
MSMYSSWMLSHLTHTNPEVLFVYYAYVAVRCCICVWAMHQNCRGKRAEWTKYLFSCNMDENGNGCILLLEASKKQTQSV